MRRHPATLAALGILVTLAGLTGCSDGDDASSSDTAVSTTAAGATSSTPGTASVKADAQLAVGDAVAAEVDPRFQSYNIEMVEVTGGQFWAPYSANGGKVTRPPIDLASPRIRNLAKALGPVYIRVSGTWANNTYFDVDGSTGGTPPEGFTGVLTPQQWLGVGAFADAVDGQIVTSLPATDVARDADGVWQPDLARTLLEFTAENDLPVVAIEPFNEPSIPVGFPEGYDAKEFGRDIATAQKLIDEVLPDALTVGPGGSNEIVPLMPGTFGAADAIDATGDIFDVFSYHFYPKLSERCGSKATPDIALDAEYLNGVVLERDNFRKIRDEKLPGAPIWVTETAQAACGGDRWAATARDVPRYIDMLGKFAGSDGDVVFHNTLAASDYALIDEDGFVPRPNYWAAVLWAQLMGPKVLAPQASGVEDLAVYAHCLPSSAPKPGIAYAIVNTSADTDRTVATASGSASVFVLHAEDLDATTIALNDTELTVAEDGTFEDLTGVDAKGAVTIPAASVAFVVDTETAGPCR